MEFLQVLHKIITTAGTVVSIVMGVWGALTYLLHNGAMFKIARRRKIKGAWLAWFPIASEWLLGAICDQYQRYKYGHDRNRRGKLLTLALLSSSGGLLSPVIKKVVELAQNGVLLDMLKQLQGGQIALLVVGAVLLGVAAVVVYFLQMITQFKAYYFLFASCKPKAAVPFLLLSIMTPANPFLVFACRKHDNGMPVQTE